VNTTKELIGLTAVVPARNGCNLQCAGCIIDQRKEGAVTVLSDEDYLRFFEETMKLPEVTWFGLQGYEPLLPESWALSKELMSMSLQNDLLTSCITNGVYLDRYASEILDVSHNLYVSIDSHDPVIHDMSRGVQGAWSDTLRGVRRVQAEFGDKDQFGKYLYVASILYPGKVKRLLGIPKMLSELGVKHWGITPFVSIKKKGYLNPGQVKTDMLALDEEAKRWGVAMTLSDELRMLEDVDDIYHRFVIATLEKDHTVTRLSPDGGYSVAKEIVEANSPRFWDKVQSPSSFVRESHKEYRANNPR
jgi:MoaA/NifB/PqqE/SkfB family radical SAM enzyme